MYKLRTLCAFQISKKISNPNLKDIIKEVSADNRLYLSAADNRLQKCAADNRQINFPINQ